MKKLELMLICILGVALATPACNTRKDYPEPNIGSHSPSYSSVFGRLQRVAGATPTAAPTWVIRFGNPHDAYQGEFALSPPERMVGYSGGERVEIKGRIMSEPTTDAYNGRWYVVDSIQIWSNYR